jgi:hypothetical protein
MRWFSVKYVTSSCPTLYNPNNYQTMWRPSKGRERLLPFSSHSLGQGTWTLTFQMHPYGGQWAFLWLIVTWSSVIGCTFLATVRTLSTGHNSTEKSPSEKIIVVQLVKKCTVSYEIHIIIKLKMTLYFVMLRRVVWQKFTNVSEVLTALIIRAIDGGSKDI